MQPEELSERLVPFMRTHLEDPWAKVVSCENAPGHAGFAYLFDIQSEGKLLRYWMRLPPPNVKLEGTADVLRQVSVLNALDETDVPHCPVLWSGDDPQWFGRPYFIVERIEGARELVPRRKSPGFVETSAYDRMQLGTGRFA